MIDEKFGLFAINFNVKVTQEPKEFANMIKIPCSMGFKSKDGFWVNEWISVLVFDKSLSEGIVKGDRIKVSGRVVLTEWVNKTAEKKKEWTCFADEILKTGETNPF